MIFYSPMNWLVEHYWVVILVAVVMGAIAFVKMKGNRLIKWGAMIWIAYALWEGAVQYFTPAANIRIDLLLIWPVLLVASLLFLVGLLRGAKNHG